MIAQRLNLREEPRGFAAGGQLAGLRQSSSPALVAGGLAAPQVQSKTTRGLIATPGAGRADRVPLRVKPGSYVIPADIVSGLGQGNSLGGAKLISELINSHPLNQSSGPYGMNTPKTHMGRGVHMPHVSNVGNVSYVDFRRHFDAHNAMRADGGVGDRDIIVAGGEYVLDPDDVATFGGGDLDQGHKNLDELVENVRKQIIAHLSKLPGPKK